jgi:hypothetical protein
MLQRLKPEYDGGPDDILSGTCGSCAAAVVVARTQALPPPLPSAQGRPAGVWDDLWSTGCGRCGARVFLTANASSTHATTRQKS